jgi:D-3-phosphoglycerate dehydrogenase
MKQPLPVALLVDHPYFPRQAVLAAFGRSGLSEQFELQWSGGPGDAVDPRGVRVLMQMDHSLSAGEMDRYPKLEFVSLLMTGTDQFDLAHARRRGIVASNVRGYATQAVAEMNLLLALGVLRGVPRAIEDIRSGRFDACGPGRELGELRAGILGLGAIGVRTAELLGPFGCKVRAWTRSGEARAGVHVEMVAFDELFGSSDVLFVQAKLVHGDQGTVGLVGARELAMLPDGAVVVNTSRAQVIDQDALTAELRSGRISAGLDVHHVEHAGPIDDLWRLPNVFALPHLGFKAARALEELGRIGIENIVAWKAGKPQNVVEE